MSYHQYRQTRGVRFRLIVIGMKRSFVIRLQGPDKFLVPPMKPIIDFLIDVPNLR